MRNMYCNKISLSLATINVMATSVLNDIVVNDEYDDETKSLAKRVLSTRLPLGDNK